MEKIEIVLVNETAKENISNFHLQLHWTNVFSVFLLILPCSILGAYLNIKAAISLITCKKARKKYIILIKMVICSALLSCLHGPLEVLILALELMQIHSKAVCGINLFVFTTINFCINMCVMVTAWERHKLINNTNRTLKSNRLKLILSSFAWFFIVPVLLAQIVGEMLSDQPISLYLKVCSLPNMKEMTSSAFSSQELLIFIVSGAKMILLFLTTGLYLWSVIVIKAKLQKVTPLSLANSEPPKPIFKLGILKRARTRNEEKLDKYPSPEVKKKMIPRKNTWESLVRKYSRTAGDPDLQITNGEARKVSTQKPPLRPKVSVVSLNKSFRKNSNSQKSLNRRSSDKNLNRNFRETQTADNKRQHVNPTVTKEPTFQLTGKTSINSRRSSVHNGPERPGRHSIDSKCSRTRTFSDKVKTFQQLTINRKLSDQIPASRIEEEMRAPKISDALLSVSLLPVTLYAVSPRTTIPCLCDRDHDDPFPPLKATSGYLSRLNSCNESNIPKVRQLSVSSSKTNESTEGKRMNKSRKRKRNLSEKSSARGKHSFCHLRNMTFGNKIYSWGPINSPSYSQSQFSFEEPNDVFESFDPSYSGSSRQTGTCTSSSKSIIKEEARQDEGYFRLNSFNESSGYIGSSENPISLISNPSLHNYSIPGMPTSTALYLTCENLHLSPESKRTAALCIRNIDELQCMQNLMPVNRAMRKVRSLEDFEKFSRDLQPPEYQQETASTLTLCDSCHNVLTEDNWESRMESRKMKKKKSQKNKKTRNVYTQTDIIDAAFQQLQEETGVCPAIKITRPSLPEEKQCECKTKDNQNLQKLFYQLISKSPKIQRKLSSAKQAEDPDTLSIGNSVRSGMTVRSNSYADSQRLFSPSPQKIVMLRSMLLILSMLVNIVPCYMLEMFNLFSHKLASNVVALYPIFHGLQILHVVTNSVLYIYTNVRLMQLIKEE